VFGLCAALGFRFAPRIRDVFDQRLFTIGRPEQDYGPFNQLLTDRINTRLIEDNWDEVLRVAASIRHGTVSAALIMRKLAAYPRQNQIARALNEIGQLEKTIFILELLLDPQLRHRQERGLNDGEAVNSASPANFVGQRGEFRDRAYQDQVHRASCLHLLVEAERRGRCHTWQTVLRRSVPKVKPYRTSSSVTSHRSPGSLSILVLLLRT